MCGLISGSGATKVTVDEYTEQKAIEFDFILPKQSAVDNCLFQSARIDFQFELWEEEDGYQQFYLTDENGTVVSRNAACPGRQVRGTPNLFNEHLY